MSDTSGSHDSSSTYMYVKDSTGGSTSISDLPTQQEEQAGGEEQARDEQERGEEQARDEEQVRDEEEEVEFEEVEPEEVVPASLFPNISNTRRASFIAGSQATQSTSERSYKRKTFWKQEYNGLVAPSEVCCERYLQYLWDEKKLQHHVSRIVHASPKVDCKPPAIEARHYFSGQALKEAEHRMRIQEKRNLDMVQRIGMATSSKRKNRVDCWNKLDLYRPNVIPERKLRLRKQRKENIDLLERIMAIPPTKDSHRTHLMSEWDRHVKVKQNLRKFPKLPTITVANSRGEGDAPSASSETQSSRASLPS